MTETLLDLSNINQPTRPRTTSAKAVQLSNIVKPMIKTPLIPRPIIRSAMSQKHKRSVSAMNNTQSTFNKENSFSQDNQDITNRSRNVGSKVIPSYWEIGKGDNENLNNTNFFSLTSTTMNSYKPKQRLKMNFEYNRLELEPENKTVSFNIDTSFEASLIKYPKVKHYLDNIQKNNELLLNRNHEYSLFKDTDNYEDTEKKYYFPFVQSRLNKERPGSKTVDYKDAMKDGASYIPATTTNSGVVKKLDMGPKNKNSQEKTAFERIPGYMRDKKSRRTASADGSGMLEAADDPENGLKKSFWEHFVKHINPQNSKLRMYSNLKKAQDHIMINHSALRNESKRGLDGKFNDILRNIMKKPNERRIFSRVEQLRMESKQMPAIHRTY